MLPRPAVALAAALLFSALTGCSGGSAEQAVPSGSPSSPPGPTSPPASSTPVAAGGQVALLVAHRAAVHQDSFDDATFPDEVAALCPACTVVVRNAGGDTTRQAEQLQEVVDAGAQVVVVDAVDPLTVATGVTAALDRGVKVIGYDTLLEGMDGYVAWSAERTGRLQAHALLAATRRHARLIAVNGAATDVVATQVKAAAQEVLTDAGATLVGQYDVNPDDPAATRTWLTNAFTFFPPATLDGVYAADDAIAGQVDRALPARAKQLPVTGAGATLAGVRRLVSGRQLMTVYQPAATASQTTARVAVAELGGGDPGEPTTTLNGVPAYLLDPVAVEADDLADTVVADGYWTRAQICTRPLRADCRQAGLR